MDKSALSKNKRILKKILFPAVKARDLYVKLRDLWLAKSNPRKLAGIRYKYMMGGKKLNWDNPQDLNEKINWLKFNTDLSEWTRLSDKYRVREYLKERGREDLLVKLYGVWENAEDIDFDTLPERFVFKSNHGCGTIMLVEDKNHLDIPKVRKELNKWLKKKYGFLTVEPQYLSIKPCLIAEELLENDNPNSTSLVDYKVWCLDGKVYSIMICGNRVLDKGTELSFYDLDWNLIPDMVAGSHSMNKIIIDKPECLAELIKAAEELSKGHPEVRVDFYIVNNKIYFGEMTFTSLGGYMDYIAPKYLNEMGAKITLPKKKSDTY